MAGLARVIDVEHIEGRVLRIEFTDGLVRELDFAGSAVRHPRFDRQRNVRVGCGGLRPRNDLLAEWGRSRPRRAAR